jgi:serine protease Do
MHIGRRRATVVGLVLAASGATILFGPSISRPAIAQTSWEDESPAIASPSGLPDFASIADAVTPAVVRIESVRESRLGGDYDDTAAQSIPEPFRRFFDVPDGWDRVQPEGEMPAMAGGSGFLISPDGYIATNNHVVESSRDIRVWLQDGRSFEAQLVGADPTTDVALLKIDAHGLPALRWGRSRDLRVGDWVLAIGNPGVEGSAPLDYTVTSGIVSAKERPLGIIRQSLGELGGANAELAGYAVENFIQTDAVINPGNSGGPLVGLDGRVVGINSAIVSNSGHFEGYGFAVPSDLAQHVAQDLMEHGHVRRAWLGLKMTAVTPEDVEVFGLPSVAGAVIQSVTEHSPAAEAGLREGDVVVSLDGTPIRQSSHLQELIAEREPGDRVTLDIYRDHAERSIRLDLGEVPFSSSPARETTSPSARTPARALLGVNVVPLTPALAERYGIEDGASGIVVSEVDPLGPAGRKGIVPGMRVEEVAGRHVASMRDLEDALARIHAGQAVALKMLDRDGQSWLVNVRAQ